MNPDQIQIIRQSFALVAPQADMAAALFYRRLFEIDPGLRPLFRPDLTEQGHRLMQMLAAAVRLLDKPASLVPVLEDLGRRHVGYGVRDEHYNAVGEALLWTFDKVLGPQFTVDAQMAWSSLYCVVATTMKRAAANVRPSIQAVC